MNIKLLSVLSGSLLASVLTLTSCLPAEISPSSDSVTATTDDSTATATGNASIAGLYVYDVSEDLGVHGLNKIYIEIDSQGNLSTYSYYGDSFDLGNNCYSINLNVDQWVHLSGNTFSSNLSGTITVAKNPEGGVVFSSADNPGEDQVGYKENDLTISDFKEAECLLVTTTASSSTDTGNGSIVGIYDMSVDYGVDGVDEVYLEIDLEGYISFYDYKGDSYDLLGNCYMIDSNIDQWIHISGNTFSSNESGTITITENSEGGIVFASSDYPGEDQVGYEANNLTISDFQAAECS